MRLQFQIARCVALAGVLGMCHAPASAGRPFTTEDAAVIGKGSCEFEAFAERLRPAVDPPESGLSAQLGCGVIGATQLAFGLATSKAAGQRARAMQVSGKTQFVDGGDADVSFALAYFAARDREPNEPWRFVASGVNGVVTAPVHGWLVHLNLGVTAERLPRRNVTGWALAVERPAVLKGIDAGLEYFGDDLRTRWLQAAARWHLLPEQLLVDASLGRQTSGGRTDRFTLGLKWIF